MQLNVSPTSSESVTSMVC